MSGQQSAAHYLRHGQMPFFRLPMADLASPDPYTGLDAVLLGVPYDGGTTYQPGARLAPYHVRRVSALVQSFHPLHRTDVFARVRARDCGNVVFPPFDAASVRAAIQGELGRVVAAGAVPFVVGGDHSVALPCLRAVAAQHGPVAVVHVDAHLDTSTAEVWGDAWHHGTPLRHAIEEGLIAPGALVQIGIRGAWGDADDGQLVTRFGATTISADAVAERGVAEVVRQMRAIIGTRPVYLTFDIDAVDPAFAPGTGTPVPGGLTSREALALVRGLWGARLVGMDLVEVAPPLDHADVTSHLAAHLLYEAVALVACR